jgi:hypothetical protein
MGSAFAVDYRPTRALVCWLHHAYRYIYLMDLSLTCWKAEEIAFDRSDGRDERRRQTTTGRHDERGHVRLSQLRSAAGRTARPD